MAAQVSAQIAADAQVAASQFAAEGLGHAFVLRKPLAKVTAKKCAECGADWDQHSRDEVSDDALAIIVDVVQDSVASRIEAGLFVGGYKAALAKARADGTSMVVNCAGTRLHEFLPRTRAPFDVLRRQRRVMDLEWEDSEDYDIGLDALRETSRWIHHRRLKGRAVVINCAQGKSRSGTLAAAYCSTSCSATTSTTARPCDGYAQRVRSCLRTAASSSSSRRTGPSCASPGARRSYRE